MRTRQPSSVSVLPAPSSLDCDAALRNLVSAALGRSSRSREQIAEEMSFLTGQQITEPMLNAWTAESKREHRFPLVFLPAFCAAVDDVTVLVHLAGLAGLYIATAEQLERAALCERLIEKERTQRELDAVIARRAR